jgi:glc operon protein GlcG
MNLIHRHVRKLCEVTFELAESMDLNVSVVAVDLGGHPIVTFRGDRTAFASLEAARRKGVAAAGLQMSTAALAEMFAQDPLVQAAVHASGDMLVVPGGFPIIFGPGVIGGLGIAGGHYREDHMLGEKALAAISATAKKE